MRIQQHTAEMLEHGHRRLRILSQQCHQIQADCDTQLEPSCQGTAYQNIIEFNSQLWDECIHEHFWAIPQLLDTLPTCQ